MADRRDFRPARDTLEIGKLLRFNSVDAGRGALGGVEAILRKAP